MVGGLSSSVSFCFESGPVARAVATMSLPLAPNASEAVAEDSASSKDDLIIM